MRRTTEPFSPRRLEIAGYSGGRQPRPLTLRAMIDGAWVAAGALLCVLIACFGAGVAMLISGGGTTGGGGMSSAGGGGGGRGSSGVFSSSMILGSLGGRRMLPLLRSRIRKTIAVGTRAEVGLNSGGR